MTYNVLVRGNAMTPQRFWDIELVSVLSPLEEAKFIKLGYRKTREATSEEVERWLRRSNGASFGDIAGEFNRKESQ
jgi:hypothetical protein